MCKSLITLCYFGSSSPPDRSLLAGQSLILNSSQALLQPVSLAFTFFFSALAQSGALIPSLIHSLTEQNTSLFCGEENNTHRATKKVRRQRPIHLRSLQVFCERIPGLLPAVLLHHLWALHYYKYCLISLTGILQCGLNNSAGLSLKEDDFVRFSRFLRLLNKLKLFLKHLAKQHFVLIKIIAVRAL